MPTGSANNQKGSWGNSTTAFISVSSDQAIGEVIIQVGDDDHTSNNNGSSEQLGLAGFQIADNFIIVPPLEFADLSVTKTLNTTGSLTSGQTVTYTINVSNSGPDTATNIVVSDLPSNLIITNVTGSNSSCTISPASGVTTSVDCTITSLLNGASETITLEATVP